MKTFSKFLVGVGVLMGSLGFSANAAQSSAPRPGTSSGYNTGVATGNKSMQQNRPGGFQYDCPICRTIQQGKKGQKGFISQHFCIHHQPQHQQHQQRSSFCPVCGHQHK